MDTEKRIAALTTISAIHRQAFDKRRAYEWKVVTAVITIYVLAVAARYANNLSFDLNQYTIFAVMILSVLLAVVSTLYLCDMHERNEMNKSLYHAAETELVALIGSQPLSNALKLVQTTAHKQNPNWSRNWELTTIWSFAIGCAFLLLAK